MQIEHPNFLINIYFVNIKQTTQLQLVPEDKVAILWLTSPVSAAEVFNSFHELSMVSAYPVGISRRGHGRRALTLTRVGTRGVQGNQVRGTYITCHKECRLL